MARELVSRTRSEIEDEALRADLIEFIETIILYKVPRLTRAEIKTMLQLHDIRESRAYQEAMEEGEKKATARAIVKMAAKKMTAEEIAALLEVDIELVRQELKGRSNG